MSHEMTTRDLRSDWRQSLPRYSPRRQCGRGPANRGAPAPQASLSSGSKAGGFGDGRAPSRLNLKQGDTAVDVACETLYRELSAKGVDVLYDDTDQRAGAKFAGADLIGIPWQILVGPKGLAEGKVEVKRRADGSRENMSPADVVARLSG